MRGEVPAGGAAPHVDPFCRRDQQPDVKPEQCAQHPADGQIVIARDQPRPRASRINELQYHHPDRVTEA